jgi:hypothetical protein
MRTSAVHGLFLMLMVLLVGAAPASAAFVINEVESDGAADYIEVMNTGAASADLGGYVLEDDDDGHADTVPAGTPGPTTRSRPTAAAPTGPAR